MARKHRLGRLAATVVTGLCALGFGVAPASAADPVPPAPPAAVPPAGSVSTPPATPAPTSGEIVAKQAEVDRARLDAARAAQAYSDAQTDLARLDENIATLEGRMPDLETRIAALKRLLAQRAAVLYVGGGQSGLALLDEVSSTGDFLAGGRIARLADAAQQDSDAQMDELDATKKQLESDRAAMRDAKTRQEDLVQSASKLALNLQDALQAAAGDLQAAEARDSLARYNSAMAAQQAAASAAGTTPQGQQAPADPALAARIPVFNMVCPVAGNVTFTNDFGQPRSGGRSHQGTDVFSVRGTPNVAVADGVIKQSHNRLGGNALWLHAVDGNAYYYAHFDAYEGPFDAAASRVVKKGDVVGYTGNTGNAAGGPTHTHFEIHPGDIGPINPYPLLREMCAVQAGLRNR
jgi:murein DD-endopeptidase MepM/ murein hydrolase activator NlpD